MAKTIRLTENDLQLIIRRIINEANEATIAQYKQIFVD
jgi:phosphoribosyl-ATP pyrophosphohydrolase